MTEAYTFEARCKDCRRKLGVVTIPREHVHCGVVFEMRCRTKDCRERPIPVSFDHTVTVTARNSGY